MIVALLNTLSIILVMVAATIYGLYLGSHTWKRRALAAIVNLRGNLDEITPAIQFLGLTPSFDYALIELYGTPPWFVRRKMVKAGVPTCDECSHFVMEHRPSMTMVGIETATVGETVPVSTNLVCKHVKRRGLRRKTEPCRCVQRVRDGYIAVMEIQVERNDES